MSGREEKFWNLKVVWAIVCGCPWHLLWAAAPELTLPVQCGVQSAQLDFGRLNMHQPFQIIGEGEAVLSCHNKANAVQAVALTLFFPSIGVQSVMLSSGTAALPVHFFRDPQLSQRWGDDLYGANAWSQVLEMAAGEHRLVRVPIYAVLYHARTVPPGVYLGHVPLALRTLPP